MSGQLKIHLLVQDPQGPTSSSPMKNFPLGSHSRWRFACDRTGTRQMDRLNRGTGEPWAVHCEECRHSWEFHEVNRPDPRQKTPLTTAPKDPRPGQPPAGVVIQDDGGCCG